MSDFLYHLSVVTFFIGPCLLAIPLFNWMSGVKHREDWWRVALHHVPRVLFGLLACGFTTIGQLLLLIIACAVADVLVDRLVSVREREDGWLIGLHHVPYLFLGIALKMSLPYL